MELDKKKAVGVIRATRALSPRHPLQTIKNYQGITDRGKGGGLGGVPRTGADGESSSSDAIHESHQRLQEGQGATDAKRKYLRYKISMMDTKKGRKRRFQEKSLLRRRSKDSRRATRT